MVTPMLTDTICIYTLCFKKMKEKNTQDQKAQLHIFFLFMNVEKPSCHLTLKR